MCRIYLHQASMGKSSQKTGKSHSYLSFRKCYSTSCKGIGGHKIILKRSNNIKAVKAGVTLNVLCY